MTDDEDWRKQGLCVTTHSHLAWDGDNRTDRQSCIDACSICPVLTDCTAWADTVDGAGWWWAGVVVAGRYYHPSRLDNSGRSDNAGLRPQSRKGRPRGKRKEDA